MVRAITAAANSKLVFVSQSLSTWGRILKEPKYQKKICTRRGVLRKNSRYPWANHLTGRTLLILITAMIRPRRKERTIETTDNWMVVMSPSRSHPKYFPDVTTAQSNWYLNTWQQTSALEE
jgi:hypothetical protein